MLARWGWNRSRRLALGIAWGACGLLTARSLPAQDLLDVVHVHGYGSWSYGRTNGNAYLGGIRSGDYRNASFALNFSAHPTERLTIVSQFAVDELAGQHETKLDYAFAEWRFSDAIRLRVGKVKHPFGIYTEVFDVGTVRPFLTLPQSFYAEVGFVSEAYEGIGLRGRITPAHNWTLAYDLYAGGISLLEAEQPLAVFEGGPGATGEFSLRDVLGGRVVVGTPVPGLSIGVSSYTGVSVEDAEAGRELIVSGQIEYITNRLWLRSEFARQTEGGAGRKLTAQYVEAAYFITQHVQVAATFDRLRTSLPDVNTAEAPSLTRHTEGALGLNFWPTPEMGMKSSIHFVNGNRLAFPADASTSDFLNPALARHTVLFQFGVQFSF